MPLPSALEDVRETLRQGRALDGPQVEALAAVDDVLELGTLAAEVAARRWRGRVHYAAPLRLPLTATCSEACKVCSAWRLGSHDVDALTSAVAAAAPAEVHLVSPLDRLELSVDGCEQLLRALRTAHPTMWIQGFTPAQIESLGAPGGVLRRLQAAGLDGLLGSDEEIFTEKGRVLSTSDRLPFERTLEIHQAAHRAGLVSHATLRYGARPALAEKLRALREAQRETGGFSAFVPVPEVIEEGSHLRRSDSGYEDTLATALARLVLDNVAHVRVPWTALGLKVGQVAMSFGGDDLGWAALDPHVRVYAHPATFLALTPGEIERLVAATGRAAVPVDGAWRQVTLGGKP